MRGIDLSCGTEGENELATNGAKSIPGTEDPRAVRAPGGKPLGRFQEASETEAQREESGMRGKRTVTSYG